MEIERKDQTRLGGSAPLTSCFPAGMIEAVVSVAERDDREVYLVGGTVRDWLMGREPGDLDLAVDTKSHEFCRSLIRELGGGAFVQLGTGEEEAARVVWKGIDIDISSFRGTALTIEGDLVLRDFTVNSMAVNLMSCLRSGNGAAVIDPLSGRNDLRAGVIRHCSHAFEDDPLRLLRAFRFAATLGFEILNETKDAIRKRAQEITRPASERVRYELDLIMESSRAHDTFWAMHESGILNFLFPVLYEGAEVKQPGFHHLDVFQHNFKTLRELERIVADPLLAYPGHGKEMGEYLAAGHNRRCLKWAALFHDIGKPETQDDSEKDNWRVTFFGHDERGRELFEELARHLRWSNEDRALTGSHIAMHMHPFHLCTVRNMSGLTRRAALKLCRKAGEHLPGLFLLAMADSLASRGELKPENMEQELVDLYEEILSIYDSHIRPALSGPPLLGGKDLIDEFQLTPGPVFSVILRELQALQVEGAVSSREGAVEWVTAFLKGKTGTAATG